MKLQRYEQTRIAQVDRSQRANAYGAQQVGNVFQRVADTRGADIAAAIGGVADVVVDLQLKAQKKIDDSAARKSQMNADMELKMFQPSLDEEKADRQIKTIMGRIQAHDHSLEGRSEDIDNTFTLNREFYQDKLKKMQVFGRIKIADQQETAEFKTNMDTSIELGETDNAIGYAQALRDKGIVVPYNDKQITSKSLASAEINSMENLPIIDVEARLDNLIEGKDGIMYDKKNSSNFIKGLHKDDAEILKAKMKKNIIDRQSHAMDKVFDRIAAGEVLSDKEINQMQATHEIDLKSANNLKKFNLDKAIKQDSNKVLELKLSLMDETQWSPNPVKRKEQLHELQRKILSLKATPTTMTSLIKDAKSAYDDASKGELSLERENQKQNLKIAQDMIKSLYKDNEAFNIKGSFAQNWLPFVDDPDPDNLQSIQRKENAITSMREFILTENPSRAEVIEKLAVEMKEWKKEQLFNEIRIKQNPYKRGK